MFSYEKYILKYILLSTQPKKPQTFSKYFSALGQTSEKFSVP